MKVGQSVSNSVQNAESNATKKGNQTGGAQEARQSERAEGQDRTSGATRGAASGGAKAEISSKAKEYSQAKSIASKTPDVREDRVAELKKKISEGTYRIDEDAIADRMIDEHLRGPKIA